ncbi:MAG: hypothetical protein ACJA0H_002191 [Francisellaceae bacterium]|jgi:hypothetical protein
MTTGTRSIIYTDASISPEKSQIAMYCAKTNVTHTLKVMGENTINDLEKISIMYAMEYALNNSISNPHILNDNLNSCNRVEKIAKHIGITVSWIPREINRIADKASRNEPNQPDITKDSLQLFAKSMALKIKAKAKNKVAQDSFDTMIKQANQAVNQVNEAKNKANKATKKANKATVKANDAVDKINQLLNGLYRTKNIIE